MKIRDGFIVRDVGGRTFVVAVGELSKTFKGMITLNETGKSIWKMLESETTEEEIVEKLLIQYEGAEKSQVEADVSNFISLLKRDNVIE